MALGDILFGKDPGVEQMMQYTPQQMQLLTQLGGILGGQMGKGIPGYEGPLTPGASPLQSQIFGLVGDLP